MELLCRSQECLPLFLYSYIKMMIRLVCFFIFIIGSFSVAAKKSSFLPNAFTAHFEQSYISSLSGKKKTTKGFIKYKFPGNIRFETTSPDRVIFVSNPVKTWYYTAPFFDDMPGELTVKRTSSNALSRFFDALKQGMITNKLYTVKTGKKFKNLIFNKKQASEIGVLKAKLFFNGKAIFNNIKKVQLTYTDKKVKSLVLSKIDTKAKFKSGYFVFKAPENTRLSK